MKNSLIIFDNLYPVIFEGKSAGRRNVENQFLLSSIPGSKVLVPPTGAPFMGNRTKQEFEAAKRIYLDQEKSVGEEQIEYFDPYKRIEGKLAYVVFQEPTARILPFLELSSLPFVFSIYPGGGFAMGEGPAKKAEIISDHQLKKIARSKMFRKAIVYHRIIFNHLVENKIIPEKKLLFINGGHVQLARHEVLPKTYFGKDRDDFNICFVAHRYSRTGECKGYDILVKTARILLQQSKKFKFHIVGDWDASVQDLSGIEDNFVFYGKQHKEFFPEFYARMDVILSPTRKNYPNMGKFDGFPLVIDAGYCGVAMFVTDPMNQNEEYISGKNIEIITRDKDDIAHRILKYLKKPKALMKLSKKGQDIVIRTRDRDQHMSQKIEYLRQEMASLDGQ
ncbi:glycosyltransferase [Aliiroseovarius marinus]|uniref:glycosyltransferase n=1 Tax=Aliiroseovarius marinus TaxID=2500159 RepID=UPI003D7D83F9